MTENKERNDHIRKLYTTGMSSAEIAKKYGISYQRVLGIVKREQYLKYRKVTRDNQREERV
jgi:uncharacterized protein YjcR